MDRRLAAILAADVVGYSRMMAADERGTLERLRAMRQEIFDPCVAQHNGRLVKLMGDGALIEFASVVDAVTCAVQIQETLDRTYQSATPEQRLDLRIGINLGDVIADGDDIYGDGVNIAARLEGVADPGGICLSQAVVEQVAHKTPFVYESLGLRHLKNIDEQVAVYRVASETSAPRPAPRQRQRSKSRRPLLISALLVLFALSAWWTWSMGLFGFGQDRSLPKQPSIAVLPFQDLSAEPQVWFGDGMAEDIITDLSKLPGLFVIARNSSFQFRGGNHDMRKVGEQLGVAYLLEGSVRRAGETLRINAQLIDASSGGHVWADRFDGAAGDVFALQDSVTEQVVQNMRMALFKPERRDDVNDDPAAPGRPPEVSPETEPIDPPQPVPPAAHEAYLRAMGHLHKRSPQDFRQARLWLDKALALSPTYPRALAARASLLLETYERGWMTLVGVPRAYSTVTDAARMALRHPSALAHAVAAELLVKKPDLDAAWAEVELGLILDPNESELYVVAALILAGRDDFDGAWSYMDRAMRLNPLAPGHFQQAAGIIHFAQGNSPAALQAYDRARDTQDANWILRLERAAVLADLGRVPEATAELVSVKEHYDAQGWQSHYAAPNLAWQNGKRINQAYVDRLAAAFRAAGIPDIPEGHDLQPDQRLTAEEIRQDVGIRLIGRCCGGEWRVDRPRTGAETYFWDGVPLFTRQRTILPDGSVTIRKQDRFAPDEFCRVYRNPDGADATFDSRFAACNHGVFRYGVFPLDAAN